MNATDTELTAFIDGLAPRARLMGVDLGTKTIGLALSDVEGASPRRWRPSGVSSSPPTSSRSRRWSSATAVGGLVVGLPLNMDGSEGPRVAGDPRFRAQPQAASAPARCCSGTSACPPSQ